MHILDFLNFKSTAKLYPPKVYLILKITPANTWQCKCSCLLLSITIFSHTIYNRFYPTAGFEVSSTTRYTGKYEACITATRDWSAGDQVKCCKGAIAELNDEDDLKLRAEGVDFSVLFSSKKNCTCLFLGPARFMNHDCEANCSFLHSGANSVSFKVNRSISVGEEMTAYYGDHYFGENNCECLCQSCEKNQKGGFAKSKKEAAGESPDAVSSNVRRSSRSKKDVDYKSKHFPHTLAILWLFTFMSIDYSIAALVKKSQAKNQTKVTKRNNKRKTSMEPTESGTPLLSSSTEDNSTQASSGPSSLSPSSFEKVTKDLNVASSSPSSSLKENELYTIENDEITCCSNQQNLPVTKLPNGQRGCAKCYRHFKVFGHEWPVRKQAVPHKQKNKEAKPSTPLPVASRKRKLEHQEDEKPVRNKKQLTTMVYSAYQPYTQMPFQPIPVRPSQQILPSIRICFPEFF